MALVSITSIDNLFKYLYNKGSRYTKYRDIVSEHFKNDETNHDIEGMLIKLEQDGFVDVGKSISDKKLGWTQQTTYKLSFKGRLEFEKNEEPYRFLQRKENLSRIWVTLKIIVTVLNSVAVLYLMWKAIPK